LKLTRRLREEVVSQGIELQRRWLRSIKTQVETERGGRLAKLDQLTTSLKQLERITLDNSATLDENVRVNKVWSALRALQTKAEQGDVAFEHELRVLKSLTVNPESDSSTSKSSSSVITPALKALEASGAATTGVKSFASLSTWFTNSVAPRVHSASLTPTPEESTVVSHLASIALSKIMFRPRAGVIEGDDVGSVLARAEWCLGEKDLDGAAREVNGLKGWPGKLAADWLREARRKLEVQQALDVVMTEATLESLLLS
jgi:mitofilin